MKNRFFIMGSMLTGMLASIAASAESRSVGEAQMEALRFLSSNASAVKHAPSKQSVGLSYTLKQIDSQKDAAYLFQVGEEGGYVLVSADDHVQTILGYTDAGHFDASDIPVNMQMWLMHYAEEISWASEHGAKSNGQMKASGQPIAPLLGSIIWNQDKPYNNQCPYDSDGTRSYTGCVATATAQVMKFWNYPEKGTGSHSYYWTKTNGSTQLLSADFGSTTYDWNNMLPSYRVSYTTSQANAVAKLMYHIGVATEMGYSSKGSGTQTERAARALFNNFGYDKSLYTVRPDYIGFEAFGEQMLEELRAGRPVLMSGYTENDEGHAFVCDGFDGTYFHINWGWGGAQNGYFALSALDPEEQGIGGAASGAGFHLGVMGVMGIQPDKGGELAPCSLGTLEMKLKSSKTISMDDKFIVSLNQIANIGLNDLEENCVIGLAIYDNEDYFVNWFDGFYSQGLPSGYYYPGDIDFEGNLSSLTDDGDYSIVPIFTDANQEYAWAMETAYGTPTSIPFNKKGNVITFDVEEDSIPEPAYKVWDLEAEVREDTILFHFEGDAPYYHVKIYNIDTYIDFKSAVVRNMPDGKWTVWVCAADENKKDVGNPLTVEVTVETIDYNINNFEAIAIGNKIQFTFESDAPYFHAKIYNSQQVWIDDYIDFKSASVSNMPDGEWTVWVCAADNNKIDHGNPVSAKVTTYDGSIKSLLAIADEQTINISIDSKAPLFQVKVTKGSQQIYSNILADKLISIKGVEEGVWSVWARPVDADMKYYVGDAVETTVTVLPRIYAITYLVSDTVYQVDSVRHRDTITLPTDPVMIGHTFKGWLDLPVNLIMPDHNITSSASFETNSYSVMYFVDTVKVHQDEVLYGQPLELWTYVPEDETITFNGWTGDQYETMPDHNLSYYADITVGIAQISCNAEIVEGIYTLDGKKIGKAQQGIYVVRMSDGSIRKCIIK